MKDVCHDEDDKDKVNLKETFPSEYTKHGIKAFWISGTISLSNEPINSVSIGNRFSYLTIEVEQGKIVKIKEEGPYFEPEPESERL